MRGHYGVAAVCAVAVVSMLGSSQPTWTVDATDQGRAVEGSAGRQALVLLAPESLLVPAALQAAAGDEDLLSAAVDGHDIPGAALAAYQRAAAVLAEAASECGLSWPLLAGIGRVESDHGRYGGAGLGADGVSRPPIVGVALDGAGAVAEIRDTDDGALDGDVVWDRAVGPMQFLPATWALAGVDGDADGARNPHDLDDAALAAGVYLCAGGGDLSQAKDVRAALLRYNPSTSYAALVMAFERRYRAGRFALDAGPAVTADVPDAEAVSALTRGAHATSTVRPPASATVAAARAAGSRVDRATPVPTQPPGPGPQPDAGPASETGAATEPDTASRAPAEPDPEPGPALGAAPEPDPDPAPDPAPEPDPEPASEPDPTAVPGTSPAADPQETGPTAGPEDLAEPDRVTLTGVLTACDGWLCLDQQVLVPAQPALLDQPAEGDLDGDGEVESYLAEVTGLVGRDVVVVVDRQEAGWLLHAIHELVEALTP